MTSWIWTSEIFKALLSDRSSVPAAEAGKSSNHMVVGYACSLTVLNNVVKDVRLSDGLCVFHEMLVLPAAQNTRAAADKTYLNDVIISICRRPSSSPTSDYNDSLFNEFSRKT